MDEKTPKTGAQKFGEFVGYSIIAVTFIVFLVASASFAWWAWSTAMGWR